MSKRNIHPTDIQFDENTVIEDIDLTEEEIIVDGERLTDERAEQINADVLAKARAYNENLIPGGKSLSGGSTHSPAIQVVVSEDTHAKLKELAHRRHVSVSKLLRPVLDEFARTGNAGEV